MTCHLCYLISDNLSEISYRRELMILPEDYPRGDMEVNFSEPQLGAGVRPRFSDLYD
jgi:hypothetical protein